MTEQRLAPNMKTCTKHPQPTHRIIRTTRRHMLFYFLLLFFFASARALLINALSVSASTSYAKHFTCLSFIIACCLLFAGPSPCFVYFKCLQTFYRVISAYGCAYCLRAVSFVSLQRLHGSFANLCQTLDIASIAVANFQLLNPLLGAFPSASVVFGCSTFCCHQVLLSAVMALLRFVSVLPFVVVLSVRRRCCRLRNCRYRHRRRNRHCHRCCKRRTRPMLPTARYLLIAACCR